MSITIKGLKIVLFIMKAILFISILVLGCIILSKYVYEYEWYIQLLSFMGLYFVAYRFMDIWDIKDKLDEIDIKLKYMKLK